MDYNIVLLLLGLAFVLTTSSSLLATSGSGREDNGGNKPNENGIEPGEISGSISVTFTGELWLNIFVDTYSILAAIEVVDIDDGSLAYSVSIAGIAELGNTPEKSKLQLDTSPLQKTMFSTPIEASQKFVALIHTLDIKLTQESLRSVPFAVEGGWRSPEGCRQFIKKLMEEHEEE